jgi:quercetin dioxygenase-like cupin family protein
MNKTVLLLLLAFSSALALSSANAQVGKVTRLMTKDLPDVPGKEGMVETVDFAPGEVSQPHRHNADLFVYVLEGSIITQVKGGSPRQFTPATSFTNRPRMYTS